MSAGWNFFVVACAILIFSIINLSIGPVINRVVSSSWGISNCQELVDKYEEDKIEKPDMSEQTRKEREINIRKCKNKKAFHNMEYTSFIFNIFIGFVCVLLGLYGLQKEIIPKTGYIGMGCGLVGFVLTLVYVIYNGVVYTNYHDSDIYKIDGDGAFAELNEKEGAYECFYYKKNDTDAIYAKYCDLIKSQYNYNYALKNSFKIDLEKRECTSSSPYYCAESQYIRLSYTYRNVYGNLVNCSKIYYTYSFDDEFTRYNLSARFLTVLLLSIIILLCYCGLIFSGFMLSKE